MNTNPSNLIAAAKQNGEVTMTAEQVINWINSRRSIGNLTIPAPTDAQIRVAVGCAMSAPDHKKLQPWRFIVSKGNARHQLGKAMLSAALAKAERDGEELDEVTRKKTYNLPLRAPVIITVVSKIQFHPKVPNFEQLLSVGAATQNLLLALKAQGFSSVWRTGLLANEPAVKAYFNIGTDDYVAAFVYTGTAKCRMPLRPPCDSDTVLSFDDGLTGELLTGLATNEPTH